MPDPPSSSSTPATPGPAGSSTAPTISGPAGSSTAPSTSGPAGSSTVPTISGPAGLFGGVFARGGADLSDRAWLQAMLDTEAALARALERAGLAAPGAGAAVTAAARAGRFDLDDLGRQAALTGNPVPALVRALHALLPPEVSAAVHQGATSQDIIDTAMMLLARSASDATLASVAGAADAAAGLAERHQDTLMIGRTLLQQAVPQPGGGTRRGGSSAMPHKHNPVASIAILGCTRQVPGLVATMIATAEQEHQRAVGAWHAGWQPLTTLLRLTASAASWCEDLLAGLEVDAGAIRANLDAAGGLPMSEHVTALLAAKLGALAAHDLVADAAASGRSFRDALADATDALTAEEIDAALDPAGYLGAAGDFTRRALSAHHRDHPR